MTELYEDLDWRGLIHQVTDPELPKLLDEESLTAYVGFDASADSLHHGNLLQLCQLRRLQLAGHKPILVAGGATGMIGDPGGKSEERPLLSAEEVEANVERIRPQLDLLFDGDALIVNNADWLTRVGYMDFLRDVGKLVTVNQMIAKESVKARLEERDQGISYTEFSYMLLQAYDFRHLFDTYDCVLQLGGSDQWGNIVTGVDLIHRTRPGSAAYGLTSPLVVKADGSKFGKSEVGAIFLGAHRTSPYQFFQYWMRVDDRDAGMFLRYFTFLPRGRVEELDRAVAERPEQREAQRVLAWEMTKLVHGEAEAERARKASEALFTEDIHALEESMLLDAFADAPSSECPRSSMDGDGLPLVDVLASSGLASSKSDARRALDQRSVSVNNRRVEDPDARLTPTDLLHGRYVVLRRGRKQHHLLRFA